MTAMRSTVLLAVMAICAVIAPAAVAQSFPPYDGLQAFHAIEGPDGPEEFSWEVMLDEEDELRAIDDTHAGVFWVGTDTLAMSIVAQKAHDAEGATVPTTIAVVQPNILTLTVHHAAGNPAAGGAPFHYPVVPGAGWEGVSGLSRSLCLRASLYPPHRRNASSQTSAGEPCARPAGC